MNKRRKWNILYLIFCLIYVGWMINLSSYECEKINSQYHRITENLNPERLKLSARKELTNRCRRKLQRNEAPLRENCSEWSALELTTQEEKIAEKLLEEKKRAHLKLILFYTGFVVFFLLAPMLLGYLLIVAAIKIKKSVTIVK